jgi:hypothetical protein
MFLTGGSKYKKFVDLDRRFEVFCERIEKIKLKYVESASEMDLVDTSSTILAASPRPAAPAKPESIPTADNIV